MGIYLNPDNKDFQRALNSKIYIDKSELVSYTNSIMNTEQQFVCSSRPRRFGKSMAANMLTAYYSRGCDSGELFKNLNISKAESFEKHLNKYNVIHLNMQNFLSRTQSIDQMIALITNAVCRDIFREYPDIDYLDVTILSCVLEDVFQECKTPFVIIIDEWDCIFRVNKKVRRTLRTKYVYRDLHDRCKTC